MPACDIHDVGLDPAERDFYREVLTRLNDSGLPFLVGGAYALACHAGIVRHTKDLDIFINKGDLDAVFGVLQAAGCRTELTFPHWLGKGFRGENFIDVIFSSGNGVADVDDDWFAHAATGEVQGIPVRLCPAEEMIWQKAFIMERERFDGADVAHLIRAGAERLDWQRLARRFAPRDTRILLAHVLLFGYTYPGERGRIPDWVVPELLRQVEQEPAAADPKACRGPILSRAQYLIDLDRWGYRDARLAPEGPMTTEEVAHWTAAIDG